MFTAYFKLVGMEWKNMNIFITAKGDEILQQQMGGSENVCSKFEEQIINQSVSGN